MEARGEGEVSCLGVRRYRDRDRARLRRRDRQVRHGRRWPPSRRPKTRPHPNKLDRTVLPIPEPKLAPITELDARNAKAPPRFEVKAPARCAQRADRADRRHGLRPVQRLRRADPHADARATGQGRAALQPVPHHGALLADPRGPADRPQPSRLQHGLDHGDRHRLPRPDRAAPQQRGAAGRDAAAQRLQHRRLRQVARDRRLGSQPVRPDRPLADPLRLRQVLRLHRRRNEPVGAGHLRRHEPDRAAEGSELPLHDRHDQPGDQVDAAPRNR